MTRDEARETILALWREWRKGQPERLADRAKFYGWLQQDRPDLLAFPGLFDRRLHVSGWLLTHDHVEGRRDRTRPPAATARSHPRSLGAAPRRV